MIALYTLRVFFSQLAEGYAWVLLMPSVPAGFGVMAATFASPQLGIAGLTGAATALLMSRWMRVTGSLSSVYVFNGLLTGMFLAAHYLPNTLFFILLIITTALAGLIASWFNASLWQFSHLPVLSLPFLIIANLAQLAASNYPLLLPIHASAPLSAVWPDVFFSSLGSIFVLPNPWFGTALFIILLVTSRTLAFLAIIGCLAGIFWQFIFSGDITPPPWIFNSMLAAMATGGLFVLPSLGSLLLGIVSALLAAFFATALNHLLIPLGLESLVLPFILSTWLCLFAAKQSGQPVVLGGRLQSPEKSLEDGRLARARLGSPSSIALTPPFMGEWQVSQGCNGVHTHRGIWREALDFLVTKDGCSFHGSGQLLEDFFCFSLPIVSPCYGQVVQLENNVPDNAIGHVNLRENWGNYLLIRLNTGSFVLLAHLRQGSSWVNVGDWVYPGQMLAHCGNSGRSPQPHLHLSVVRNEAPDAETQPFHLCGILLRKENGPAAFHLWAKPQSSDLVSAAWSGAVRPMPLLVGLGRSYQVRVNGGPWQNWQITPQLTLSGQFRLVADSGASCCCEENGAVFACYGRDGARDVFFDLWLLAVGCTPASEQAKQWQDAPPTRLLPGKWRWLDLILWPFAAVLNAHYQRSFDHTAKVWRQSGSYSFLGLHTLTIDSAIVANNGLTHLRATGSNQCWEMELKGAFQTSDLGVPEREWTISVN